MRERFGIVIFQLGFCKWCYVGGVFMLVILYYKEKRDKIEGIGWVVV